MNLDRRYSSMLSEQQILPMPARSTVGPIVVSSPGLMPSFTRRIHCNDVEQYASVVYRQSPCIEGPWNGHLLEFVTFLFVWAESFERQAVFKIYPQLTNISIHHDFLWYGL